MMCFFTFYVINGYIIASNDIIVYFYYNDE